MITVFDINKERSPINADNVKPLSVFTDTYLYDQYTIDEGLSTFRTALCY